MPPIFQEIIYVICDIYVIHFVSDILLFQEPLKDSKLNLDLDLFQDDPCTIGSNICDDPFISYRDDSLSSPSYCGTPESCLSLVSVGWFFVFLFIFCLNQNAKVDKAASWFILKLMHLMHNNNSNKYNEYSFHKMIIKL